MAISTRNKRDISFSMTSMSDIVFLLLIFFLITSTLISPSALKLMLPESNNQTVEKPPKIIVAVNDNYEYFIGINSQDMTMIDEKALLYNLSQRLSGFKEASIRLEASKHVAVQHIVNVIDAVNTINQNNHAKHKVVLATAPRK